MSQSYRFTCLLAMIILCAVILSSSSAFAQKIDFSKCAANPDHHCYSFSPQLNQVPATGSSNWSFDIFMPTSACNIKGVMDNQGNCNTPSLTVSQDNYTNTKNNVGVESLENIHTVTSNPNTNYCPLGLFTLNNQDGYLYKIYNNATGLDLTAFMYPSYCYAETGKNPINGQGGSIASPLSVNTDKSVYSAGEIITIKGTAPKQTPDLTLMVISPTMNIVTISQITPVGGVFGKTIQTGGVLWQQTGIYTVKITQGSLSSTTNFTLTSAVPEFPIVGGVLIIIVGFSILISTWWMPFTGKSKL